MDDTKDDANAIVAGILADADAEAARILADAEAYAVASAARAADQEETISRESRAKADSMAAAIVADAEAKAGIERRKRTLQFQESLVRAIVDSVEGRLSDMISKPGYRDALRRWIVESAIGLSVDSASVNASAAELPLVDAELLRSAEAAVLSEGGKAMKLRLSADNPLAGQGVFLTADGGRLAYDNRVATRIGRSRADIRKLVYSALFDSRLS